MKYIFFSIFLLCLFSCNTIQDARTKNFPKSLEAVEQIPKNENVWVFVLAGQSNMAGRGFV